LFGLKSGFERKVCGKFSCLDAEMNGAKRRENL